MSETYLGFDFGKKHIGVAVGQTVTKTAQPLPSLEAKNGVPSWPEIEKLIEKWKPCALIVGIPLNMDDSEYWLTQSAKEFSKQLAEKTALPVHEVDERLSTKEARDMLFEKRGYKALDKSSVDGVSATLIIETWLNK